MPFPDQIAYVNSMDAQLGMGVNKQSSILDGPEGILRRDI
jgi:hypothetical protein